MKRAARYNGMANRSMQVKLNTGAALDVSPFRDRKHEWLFEIPPGFFQESADYCAADTEEWIWSIGVRLADGKVFASTNGVFYGSPKFNCVWLR